MNIKYPTSYIILLCLFYGILGFVIIEAFRLSGLSALVLFLPLVLTLKAFLTETEFNPIHKNPNFFSLDGTFSVVEKKPTPIHGNQSSVIISTKKSYVPRDKWFKMGGMVGLKSHLANRVQMEIIDDSYKFIQLRDENLGAEEGCY